jgi:hypothetical protein
LHKLDLMIDVVAVLRPEDLVVDFLSVLESGREVHLVVAERGAYLKMPDGVPLAGRLAAVGELLLGASEGDKPFSPGAAADAIALETGDVAATVWTHNPADTRERRARWALEIATLVRAPVLHAVGDSRLFQWVTDLDVRLGAPAIEAKVGFVNTHCADLLRLDEEDENALTTWRIHSVERFFGSEPGERARLFALTGSMTEDAAQVTDPWEFATSQYENERLDATVNWLRGHLDPAAGRVIEVGACEGALTRRLLADHYTVDATEPNRAFLARLHENVDGEVRIHPHSFEELTTTARLTGSAYLLIELLYYEQDLSLLDRFPTDRVFVSMEPAALAKQTWPSTWSVEEEVELAQPRVEPVAGGRAYLRKPGSRGVLLRRR